MITKNTVFVIGAGASFPYGFPIGITLRENICKWLAADPAQVFDGDKQSLMLNVGIEKPTIREFTQAFYQSRVQSIDTFLAHRKEFQRIGKALIALQLGPEEKIRAIQASQFGGKCWYTHLFNRMLHDTSRIEEFAHNRVAFVTFNYDRSLEEFLSTCIIHTFGVEPKRAYEVLRGFAVSEPMGIATETRSVRHRARVHFEAMNHHHAPRRPTSGRGTLKTTPRHSARAL